MNKELKPCPFCGGEAVLFIDESCYYKSAVYCGKCRVSTPREHIPEIAIDTWNTRKPIEDIAKQLYECSWWTPPTYDEDGYCNDDSAEVVDLDTAIEIVEGNYS